MRQDSSAKRNPHNRICFTATVDLDSVCVATCRPFVSCLFSLGRNRYPMESFECPKLFALVSPRMSHARHLAFSDELHPVCFMTLLFRSLALPFGTFASLFVSVLLFESANSKERLCLTPLVHIFVRRHCQRAPLWVSLRFSLHARTQASKQFHS
jgi:hypothetical protein